MRFVLPILVIVLFVIGGIAFGALNAELVGYDFGFAHLDLPKGAALLAALLIGWLLGGLVAWLGLARRSRKPERKSKAGGQRGTATSP